MAILVTGGAGYIGSHTSVELLSAGEEIVILDNFINSKPDVLRRIVDITGRNFGFEAVDLLDEMRVREVFCRWKIDAVIHFAGLKAVGESVEKPLGYYQNNITGTLNLLAAMSAAGCKRLVFSSSATVYGMSENLPFREGAPTSATNPYGMSKLIIERILTDLCASDPEFAIASLRYFNPIGAHESGLIGEDPAGIPNNLLPYIARVADGSLDYLRVFGDDYPTTDGTGVRDYLHVTDLAVGHIRALEFLRGQAGANVINLGTGRGHSVFEVLRAFEQASGREIPYKVLPRRAGDIAVCYADASLAEKLLGWKANRTLDEMCRDSWRFQSGGN